jgi:hypothetical protein
MAKLHELLAVEGNLKGQADQVRGNLTATFEKKPHLFTEKTVVFKPIAENLEPVREEQLDLQTTVPKELNWLSGICAKALDVEYQVANGNTQARADVVVDGITFLKGAPATALLSLEKRVNEIQHLVAKIPTLDYAKGFRVDETRGRDVFAAREVIKPRTQKQQRPLILAPATDKHAAQVQLISEDVEIGKVSTTEWSGLITPAVKASMLERVEKLARAVKQARCRANEVEVDQSQTFGAQLLSYVFNGQDESGTEQPTSRHASLR